MSNSLNRNIEQDEVVVIKPTSLKPEYRKEFTHFICQGGFGMSSTTIGAKIFGKWLHNDEEDYIRGEWIDVKATNKYQKEKQNV